jgi:hypothetical protein
MIGILDLFGLFGNGSEVAKYADGGNIGEKVKIELNNGKIIVGVLEKINPIKIRIDATSTQVIPNSLIKNINKLEYAKGGSIKNYKKFGKENSDLVNFNLDKLDPFEEMQYNNFSKSMEKAEALQILINNVEGDYSQLSTSLAKIAEKQYPSDELEDDNSSENYAKGGGVFAKGGMIVYLDGVEAKKFTTKKALYDFVRSQVNTDVKKVEIDYGNRIIPTFDTYLIEEGKLVHKGELIQKNIDLAEVERERVETEKSINRMMGH